jgi:hypothetical protein
MVKQITAFGQNDQTSAPGRNRFDAKRHPCYYVARFSQSVENYMTLKQKKELTQAQKNPLFWVLVIAATALVFSSFLPRANA